MTRRARQRRMVVVYNPAKAEYIDTLTGTQVSPLVTGATPTGQKFIRLRPAPGEPFQNLEVDRIDLDPRKDSYGMVRGSRKEYLRQAQERAKEEKRMAKKKKPLFKGIPTYDQIMRKAGIRSTFDSVEEAYSELEDATGMTHWNLDAIVDCDMHIEFMDSVEVRKGKSRRHYSLAQTPRGEEILYGDRGRFRMQIGETETGEPIYRCQSGSWVVPNMIKYLLGQARGRRWDKVPWDQIGDYVGRVWEAMGDEGMVRQTHSKLSWVHPAAAEGVLPPEDVVLYIAEKVGDEQAAIVAEGFRMQELASLAGSYWHILRPETKHGRRRLKCIPADHRKILRHRAKTLEAWAKDPGLAPDWACGMSYVCDYPGLREDLRLIQDACEDPYDPSWPDRIRAEYRRAGRPAWELEGVGIYPLELDPAADPSFALTGGPVAEVEELDLPWEDVSSEQVSAGRAYEDLDLPWEQSVANPQRWRSRGRATPEEQARTLRGVRQVRRYLADVEWIAKAKDLGSIAFVLERDLHRFQSPIVRATLGDVARARSSELGFDCAARDSEECAHEIIQYVRNRQQTLLNARPKGHAPGRRLTEREEQEAARKVADAKRFAAQHLQEFELSQADIEALYPGYEPEKPRGISRERLRSLKRKLMR